MSKRRSTCKPARLAGSGRKLVSFPTSIEENEQTKAANQICLGLAAFHATFGFDDNNQESFFHGFSPHEIRLASDIARIRRKQVASEHRARGFVYNPSSLFPPNISKPTAVLSSASESSTEPNASFTAPNTDGSNKNSPVIASNEKETLKKSSLQKKAKKSLDNVCLEDLSKPMGRKFVLPIRSAHSSRIIKPNKRFREYDEDEWSCDGSEGSTVKKIRLESFSDDSSSSLSVGKREGAGMSDYESASGWSSSVSTASSSVQDEDISSSLPAKVILRKAKLKVDSSLSPVPGGNTSESGNPSAQKVVCGVCGAVRFYKYVMQARKFGVYSCESCRKFISRVIHNSFSKIICRTGKGNCIIPPYMKDPVSGKVWSGRCNACWLKICLHCYCMPPDLHHRLSRLLPSPMRPGPSDTDCEDDTMETKKKLQLREDSRKYLKLTSSKMSSKLNHKLMEQQILMAKSLRKKAEALIRREATLKTQTTQDAVKSDDAAAQPQARVKRKYVRKAINNSADLNLKRKKNKKDVSMGEEKPQKLNLKGPRVKHVCRSASLVLGQPVATFTDSSPSKATMNNSGEDGNVSHMQAVTSETNESDPSLKKDLSSKNKVLTDTETEVQTSGKMKCKPPPLPEVEYRSEALLDGKARTLQDLTRQHYELVNGATLEQEHSGLIYTDFWEPYDPDTVSKSGFALVGYNNSFTSKPVCFVCGCSGNDKVIHCACCCEPFHHYCVEGMGTGVVEKGADWWLVDWVCARCTMCRSCGKGGGNQVSCQRCRKSFHTECLTADRVASKLHSADRPWVCQSCLCCKSCNATEVYKFVGNLPLCRTCFKLRQRGNFCPLCQSCYDDNDFDTKMMECERCKCWVHAKCEGLSNEKYHILSILPDSVEFVCRMCCKEPPAPWWVAVEAEIRAGFLAVIKSLSKNRKACDLLKWSPTKRPSVCMCSNRPAPGSLRFPDLSEQSDAESADVRLTNKDDTSTTEEEFRKRLHSDETLVYGRSTGTEQDCLQQLKLDSDTISYQNSEKPPQFSPHATSQSDSGIGSTDDELKSTNDQCYCLETWKDPLTLLTVKKKVISNEYISLETFNKEMEEMINSQQGEELMKIYHQTLEDVFPWFNPLCSEVFESVTRVNNITESFDQDNNIYGEEIPKQKEIEDVKITLKDKLNLDSEYYYKLDKFVDERICVFCKRLGEGRTSEEGRLLYCGQGDWVHSNCALWSNEVFEEIDGALQNVQSAISRSRHIRCSTCMKKGASVGCCNRTCPEAYHFKCARNSDCVFFEDKSLFCINHRKDSKSSRLLNRDEDFFVTRPVYVELDSKKKKTVLKQNVQVMIGSLMISSLGEIAPDLSDQEDALVPCNYQCTRMFWSSVEPWRLVQYTIRTKIVYALSNPGVENEHNFTVDHCPEMDLFPPVKAQFECDESEVQEVMENLVEGVCAKEDEDPQASADLLPPELKDAIFEDLPHDLFDGISVQDIFAKLDYDFSDSKPNRDTKSQNTKNQKLSAEQYSISPVKNNETKSSKLSLSLKKKTKVLSDDVKRVKSNDEKENTDRWLSKIIQIDGAGDCSNDSSDICSSEMLESSDCLTDIIIRNNRKPVRVIKDISSILFEEQCSSDGSSECSNLGSPVWKLGQVDGTMDFCSVKDNEDLDENPVKCSRCHRTYRNAQSLERHLQTCSTDYILSCSESDSSEEDKVSNSAEAKLIDNEEAELKTVDEEASFADEEFIANEENNENYNPTEDELNTFNHQNYDDNTNSIDDNTSSSFHNQTIFEEVTDFSSHFMQSPVDFNSSVQTDQTELPFTSKPKTIRAMIESKESQGFEIPLCGKTSPVTIRPVKTYVRKKKVMTTTNAVAPPQQAMVQYQTPSHNNAPTLIIQSVPQNSLQYSYVKPQIPVAIPFSIQPVIPTVPGYLIQPAEYVMNTPAQPNNVYITNVNQPMYLNMETMVSNHTVMSSNQFVNGMSYSATTTQVYQTAKPMMEMPQSYVVVSTQNTQPQLPPTQTLYTNPPQPWTLNYQVKEKTTYEQVTGHAMVKQDTGIKLCSTSQDAYVIEKPIIKKVTVEKTHSFQQSGNVPELPQMQYTIQQSPLQSSYVHKQSISPENYFFTKTTEGFSEPQIVEHNIVEKSPSPVKSKSVENIPVGLSVHSIVNENSNQIVKSTESVKVSFTQQCEGENKPSPPKVVSPVKPIITKIKSKSKVTTDRVSSIHSQPKKISEILKLNEQISDISKVKEVKLPNAVTKKLSVQESRPKLGIKSKGETEKILEKNRVPLKENKVEQKAKKVNGRYKKALPAYNLCDPKLVYEVSSQDGISICSQDLTIAWKKIFDAVQKARAAKRLPPLPGNPLFSHLRMLGLDNNKVKYLIEQLPGAASCTKYKPTYHKCKLYGHSEPLRENVSGCARTEPHAKARRKYDMFSWLASRHRHPPKLKVNSESEIVNGISRRATSSNLPMAMRFRHLKETSKEAVGVFRSDIHGRGLFCLRDIEAGEMVIEYAGEVIRAALTDKRENFYTSKGIGCYMFRIDDYFVIDATMRGNAARFINHSCEPNCYSRVVDILGKKHILIFALHKIPKGEELTYDYKFPLEEDKITCHCLSRKCRKYLN